jgi:predicted PurR-regulated permease PerM
MTDINKKFKDLNNKITQITEETKIHNRIVNQYINKLDDIEYKSQKKISSLDNFLTSLFLLLFELFYYLNP